MPIFNQTLAYVPILQNNAMAFNASQPILDVRVCVCVHSERKKHFFFLLLRIILIIYQFNFDCFLYVENSHQKIIMRAVRVEVVAQAK